MNYENFLAQALHGAMPDAKAMVNAVNAGSDDKLGARITDLERPEGIDGAESVTEDGGRKGKGLVTKEAGSGTEERGRMLWLWKTSSLPERMS